jgi:hypothetical protein
MRMMLAAGFTTYLAKAPEDVRASMIATWKDITSISSFSFKRAMSTESQLLEWKSIGLPSDDLSQENSLVIVNSQDRVSGYVAVKTRLGFSVSLYVLYFPSDCYLYMPRDVYPSSPCLSPPYRLTINSPPTNTPTYIPTLTNPRSPSSSILPLRP